MDYETAAECYVELLQAGQFKKDAIELLLSEVDISPDLSEAEQNQLRDAIASLRKNESFEYSAEMGTIYSVLVKNKGFEKECSAIITSILNGTRLE